jgi:hypothetical protein
VPGNPAREQAERRSEEADRRFSEAGVSGRRTDRGSIFVLHGEPEAIDHEPSHRFGEPPLEHWRYPANAPVGLDGKRPARLYRRAARHTSSTFRAGRARTAIRVRRGGGRWPARAVLAAVRRAAAAGGEPGSGACSTPTVDLRAHGIREALRARRAPDPGTGGARGLDDARTAPAVDYVVRD